MGHPLAATELAPGFAPADSRGGCPHMSCGAFAFSRAGRQPGQSGEDRTKVLNSSTA